MAQINQAWHVLSDPDRRAAYDVVVRGLPSRTDGAAPVSAVAHATYRTGPPSQPLTIAPARFPWRFMLVIAVLGIAFVVVNAALTKPAPPPHPDNIMEPGSKKLPARQQHRREDVDKQADQRQYIRHWLRGCF